MNAEDTLSQLSLEEKLAQLIFVRMGSNLPPIVGASEDESRIVDLLAECPVGGLLLFNAAWPEVAESLARLQSASRVPLLIAADLERGAGQQIKGLTVFPHAMAFRNHGAQSAELISRSTAVTASQALAAGVHILFAPVADASTNPRNPIIATRAYAEDPHEAATLVAAAVRGIESAGGLSTAKHFPGHGDTSQDSHAELPMVDKSREELQRTELVPFKAAIDAGVSLMMTAHVCYPGLDPTGTPATFSRVIIEDVLRGELGYQGVVCTDSLLMEGAKAGFESEGAMAAAALAAGVDLLLDLNDPAATVRHLASEVSQGRLPAERVDEAATRVLALKSRIGDHAPRLGAAVSQPALEESRRLASQAAQGAILWRQGSPNQITLARNESVTLALFKPFSLPTDPVEQPLATELRKKVASLDYFEFDAEPSEELVLRCCEQAAASDKLVIAVIAKPAAWHAFGLTPAQQELALRLAERDNAVVAALGVNAALDAFPERLPRLCAFSDVPVSQAAVAAALCEART